VAELTEKSKQIDKIRSTNSQKTKLKGEEGQILKQIQNIKRSITQENKLSHDALYS